MRETIRSVERKEQRNKKEERKMGITLKKRIN
jgi:hypothetical protein